MESILTSIKKLLGIEEAYEQFDLEIIMLINSAFMSANQIGIGPEEGFSIEDKTATWSDFVGNRKDLKSIVAYIWHKVRLVWDPPQMGYLVDSIQKQITELEFRLNVQVYVPPDPVVEEDI